jgi:large subunit ribosomal protein L4
MQVQVYNWRGEAIGDLSLSESVFAAPVREDILARVVMWQLAKRRAGTHKTKGVSDVKATTKKPYRQKGTGRARQGSLVSPQFRGGGVVFGPVVRSHAYSLPKKVRQFGLRSALSVRMEEGQLTILDSLDLESHKTKDALPLMKKSVLIISGDQPCDRLRQAISNIPFVNILPHKALNVYDILRHQHLVISKEAIPFLHQRLHQEIENAGAL